MKTLHIALYHNLHSGGAKRVVAEHSHRLALRNSVKLFSTNSADHRFAERTGSSRVDTTLFTYTPVPMARSPFGRINSLLRMINLGRLNALSRQIAATIDKQGFDVVLVHPCQITQAPLVLRWLKTPTIYYCHELPRKLYEPAIPRPYTQARKSRQLLDWADPLLRSNRLMMRRADRQSALCATSIITNSRFTKQNIEPAYGRSAEISYLGVDATAFQPKAVQRERMVLSVGAVTPSKGFDFLIEALGTIPVAERPPLVVVANYAEPAEQQYLVALAEQHGVSLNYQFNLSEEALQGWYARTSCAAFTPVREPFGLVVLEAMAAGTPVVVVDEGGLVESVQHGFNGRIAPREPAAFGKAIMQLLAHPDEARALGQNGRASVLQNWTWEGHITQLERTLWQTMQQPLPLIAKKAL